MITINSNKLVTISISSTTSSIIQSISITSISITITIKNTIMTISSTVTVTTSRGEKPLWLGLHAHLRCGVHVPNAVAGLDDFANGTNKNRNTGS